MDLQFHGANCITVNASGTRVVVDDNLADLGGKSVSKPGDIALFTGLHADPVAGAKLTIDMPGEYEAGDFSIYGVPARAHLDEDKTRNATIYKIIAKDVRLVVLGHIHPSLSDSQLERIGVVDVLVIPVGGHGYTLDPIGALSMIKKLEPKVVVPTYYADDKLNFPVPAVDLKSAIHDLGMEPADTVGKLKFKHGSFAEGMQLVVVEKS
jgi:L-ascorbate metabolism protein UlaG (beta-lactamase superfamily)